MSGANLSSHVLDLDTGQPAAGLSVELFVADQGKPLAHAETDADGRVRTWHPAVSLSAGVYEVVFHTASWYRERGTDTFYPRVAVRFQVTAGETHYHVPLLLNRQGYTTYRGS